MHTIDRPLTRAELLPAMTKVTDLCRREGLSRVTFLDAATIADRLARGEIDPAGALRLLRHVESSRST
ncbi:hypothetical protein FOS14_18160 [Skermania sp. ID1734]|uniref:hypothetical protein n=1 Tax=Skermania sp. ID1734 TaxID=2597516 RepID=UPI00117EBB33|nr:hypothetical protein [Skermania sp. ID1734]TSD95289.1 hypothetical protein FOS14_18160 [Skermania sp. ID1734]